MLSFVSPGSLVFEESGKEAELAFGPGHTGLANLGNSCYLASVLQVLFSLPNFQERYFGPAENHLRTCNSPKPSECFACQMSKLALGMLSGRYDPAPSAADLAVIVAQRAAREERQKAIKEGKAVQEEEKTPQKKAVSLFVQRSAVCCLFSRATHCAQPTICFA